MEQTLATAKSDKMKVLEVTLIYLLFGMFFSFIGYMFADIAFESISVNLYEAENVGVLFIFFNNIGFFSVVCVLPFINFVIFSMQCMSIGTNIYQIKDLSMKIQLEIFYRHAVFEMLAILLAVSLSYQLYGVMSEYMRNSKKPSKKIYFKIIIIYIIIVILTLIGACLEGSVNV